MTFSLIAFDERTRSLASAVASRSVAVGGSVVYSRLGVGLVATQHRAHLALGNRVLDEMESGAPPSKALRKALETDSAPQERQFLALNVRDQFSVWTGRDCAGAKAETYAADYVAAGNMLAAPEVIDAMQEAYESVARAPIGERLLRCLEAGQRLGGDRRGTRAAAVKVIPPPGADQAVNLDLRVDDADAPIVELRRLFELFKQEFGP